MTRRSDRAVEDALDALDQLLDRGLLAQANREALDPRTSGADPGPITGTRSWTPPTPGDPALYAAYRTGSIDLARALRRLHPGIRLPRWTTRDQAPHVHDAQQIARVLHATLTLSQWRCRTTALERACVEIVRIVRHLDYLVGGRLTPPPPTCETRSCTNPHQHGRRCWSCVKHKTRHGEYPRIARSA